MNEDRLGFPPRLKEKHVPESTEKNPCEAWIETERGAFTYHKGRTDHIFVQYTTLPPDTVTLDPTMAAHVSAAAHNTAVGVSPIKRGSVINAKGKALPSLGKVMELNDENEHIEKEEIPALEVRLNEAVQAHKKRIVQKLS